MAVSVLVVRMSTASNSDKPPLQITLWGMREAEDTVSWRRVFGEVVLVSPLQSFWRSGSRVGTPGRDSHVRNWPNDLLTARPLQDPSHVSTVHLEICTGIDSEQVAQISQRLNFRGIGTKSPTAHCRRHAEDPDHDVNLSTRGWREPSTSAEEQRW
ncbi:hypothetical protein POSPLADRAFT_1037515 [Postia placenta MAD-698-R-SB12]|uniref:Uncharacterized protein n=1 Tax=Postia placenta MAD-698-R-SB12 TaxID=670580 RepID=A0A1X6MJN8_9APHY|nr:hypothetical protein POSPLADRAFT_1037515 [Postia placenta MAD-698-R-SB12]OSX56558.1 hypothetical protein POSPLADRAFT_1037515 [Postia placenta MAD-698-R-SB12]